MGYQHSDLRELKISDLRCHCQVREPDQTRRFPPIRNVTVVISFIVALHLPYRGPSCGGCMAAAGTAYGEHRFGQNWIGRLVLALGIALSILFVWALADDAKSSWHPGLWWTTAALVVAGIISWIAIGKTVLTISDQGVKRESVLGAQE